MTLLTTEIVPGPQARIVFGADRRISSTTGVRLSERPKIFQVPGRNAGIGYFGLAVVHRGGTQRERMDRWLTECLSRHSACPSLRQLAESIRDDLNRDVPAVDRSAYRSGLHLAGFERGTPEFWYIRNVADDRESIFGQYEIREDFRSRDAARLPPGQWQIYRNGDIRAHAAAWEHLDRGFVGLLLNEPDFRLSLNARSHAQWVRFKLETVGSFYERFAHRSIIGRPVDAFAITPSGVVHAAGRGPQSAPRKRRRARIRPSRSDS